ncbi:MAG: LysM peptidoglycan-binding domain-containing protein, partial [Chloroflexota bacterium]
MESSEENQPKLFLRPIFILGNLLIAVLLALFFSTADNLSVRGGGFAIYSDPNQDVIGGGSDGNPIQGDSAIIARGTFTPTPVATDEEPEFEDSMVDANQDTGEDVVRPTQTVVQPTPTACSHPPGWNVNYVVKRGETLNEIGVLIDVRWPVIQAANCLPSDRINAGDTIRLPQAVPETMVETVSTPIPCGGAPSDWLLYTIQKDDTVYSMAEDSGISRIDLVRFNCLRSETDIQLGQKILLPPSSPYHAGLGVAQPTNTPQPPAPTNTPQPEPTATPQPTNTIEALRDTPEPTATEMPDRPEETALPPTATQISVTVVPITPEAESTATSTTVPATNTPEPTSTPLPPTETPTVEVGSGVLVAGTVVDVAVDSVSGVIGTTVTDICVAVGGRAVSSGRSG